MLLDIFSSLDYCFSNLKFLNNMSVSWVFVVIIVVCLVQGYFFSFHNAFSYIFLNGAWINKKNGMLFIFFIFVIIFSFLFFQNVLGLFPYTFSITSHIVFNFILALEVWFMIIFYGLLNNFLGFFSHFSPFGSPFVLSNFLNLIEIVSLCIRSLTLSLRLSVNISTGHIFLGLVSSWLLICSSVLVWNISFFCFVGYFFFELFVCFIQALVFSLLLVQYLDEV
uniref:ATP synthase subunit a n=1 Tax=Bipalium kewense TaxID=66750 RepID=A0A649UCH9_9PLAT|nr:ATP synthase F0 subunit 6 [Bipalium kewense]QGI24378.1 ATP synthase F0 subunit 6 [Bipalium kewense]